MDEPPRTFSVFADFSCHVHTGTDLAEALRQARLVYAAGSAQTVVVFDDARREHRAQDLARTAQDAAFKFMSVMGGDRPNFEEVARAIYAGRFDQAVGLVAEWPADLRAHLGRLIDVAKKSGAEAP